MKNILKIAIIPSTFLPVVGGAEILTHNLANSISKKGHTVDIWNTKKGFYKKKLYKINNFNKFIVNITYLLRYYFKIKINIFLKNYLKKIIDTNKYDIWHFQSVNFKTLIIFEVLKDLDQKVIFTFHGADIQLDKKIEYGYRLNLSYDRMLKKNLKLVDRVHCISKEIKKDLIKLNFPKKKILKIPNCIYFKKFQKYKSFKPKILTLLTVARYAEKKKGFDFVEKIGRYLLNETQFKWIIIGRNVSKLSKNKFISKHKKNFKLIEEINNDELFFPNSKLIKYYKSSTIYAHLSRLESFGITVLEALTSGLPIISFKSTGSKTLIKNGVNGYLIKCYETNQYVKKIIKIYKSRKKLVKFNLNDLIKYDLDFNANKLIEDYKFLMRNKLKKIIL